MLKLERHQRHESGKMPCAVPSNPMNSWGRDGQLYDENGEI